MDRTIPLKRFDDMPVMAPQILQEPDNQPGTKFVRLNLNENPLPPSPNAIAAMHDAVNIANRYPDHSGATHDPDEAVAEVTYSQPLATYDGKLHEDDVDKALGYAWRWTNNVNGSWSRKEEQLADEDGLLFENGDYNEDVKVLLPNPTHAGKVWGRRSSMGGDIFILKPKAGSIM